MIRSTPTVLIQSIHPILCFPRIIHYTIIDNDVLSCWFLLFIGIRLSRLLRIIMRVRKIIYQFWLGLTSIIVVTFVLFVWLGVLIARGFFIVRLIIGFTCPTLSFRFICWLFLWILARFLVFIKWLFIILSLPEPIPDFSFTIR